MRLNVSPMCFLFRFAVLCMFLSTRVCGCGDSGESCPDGQSCHSPEQDEICDDGSQQCCYTRSQDEENVLYIIFSGLGLLLLVCGAVCTCIYKKRKENTEFNDM